LNCPYSQDALSMDQVWVTQIIKPTLAEDLRTSFEPHRLAKLYAIASQKLWEDATQCTQHGPP
ncbi:hypothetical protein T12_7090, partial [Trichinella patagoniensis]